MFGLLMFIVILILAGFLLPRKQRIERHVVIRGSPDHVFNLIASLKRWPEWTVWTPNRFPDMILKFEGPETGVGSVMVAAGKSSGAGTVRIIEAARKNGIAYILDFNHGLQVFTGAIHYNNTPDGLRVTWALDVELGANPLKRWAGLAMGTLMGSDMEHSLEKLKTQVEGR